MPYDLVRFLCSVLIIGFLNAHLHAQEEPDETQLEALSLLEAHHANLASLEDMDMAMELTQSRYSERLLAFEDSVVRQRLVLDADQELGVLATVHEIRRFQEEKKSQPLAMRVVVSVRMGDRVGQRQFPKPVNWVALDKDRGYTFGFASDYPDLRFIGHYPFPHSAGAFTPAVGDSILKIVRMPHPSMALRLLPDQKAVISFRSENPAQIKESKRYFDLRNSLLVSLRASRQKRNSKEMVPELVERYQWRTAADVSVPTRIEGEKLISRKGPDGKRTDWTEQYDATFRWFAVNSKIELKVGTQELLDDVNKVLKFIEAADVEDITTKLD